MEAHFKQTVEHQWTALKYVPMKMRTKELCEIAMKQNKKAFEFIPEDLKSDFLPTEEVKTEEVNKTKKSKK